MNDTTATEGAPGTEPQLRLTAAWADFSKALSIYPEANERVQGKLREVLEALAAELGARERRPGHDTERGITILFREDTVLEAGVEHAIESGSAISWLRQRVSHAGLAGAEFMPDLSGDAFLDFTKRLLANYLDRSLDPAFDALWPESYAGIVLVDRRFEGTFGGLDVGGQFAGGHGGGGRLASGSSHFVTGLLAHPKVAKRVQELAGVVAAMGVEDGEETVHTTDLVKRILDDVPAEALKGRDSLIDAVCRVMDRLAHKSERHAAGGAAGGAADGAVPDSQKFAALLHQVSRTHFARKGPGLERLKPDAEEAVEQSPAGGRNRDMAIDDDVQALVHELHALPSAPHYDLGRGDAESRPEQLAVLMHYLVNLEHPQDLKGLYPTLSRVLHNAASESLALLRQHLEAEDDDAERRTKRRAAIVRYLQGAGLTRALRSCGLLTTDAVLADVPNEFPLYLAALDPENPSELFELNGLCAGLGPSILEHEAAMRDGLAALPRAQAAALLARPHRARLPLVRLLVAAHPGRLIAETTVFLRSVRLPEDEAFLLFQLHELAHFSQAYLADLIDLHFGRTDVVTVRRHVVEILCRHIRASRRPLPMHPERLASIRSLARYPFANGWVLLQQLQKTRFGFFGGAEPRAIRKLARTVARDFNTSRERNEGPAAMDATGAPESPQPDDGSEQGRPEAA